MLNKKNTIRLLYGLLALILLAFAAITVYRQSISTTDENWFINAPAKVSITKEIAALNKSTNFRNLQEGDLVTGFGNLVAPSKDKILQQIESGKKDTLLFKILRPSVNQNFNISVKKSALPDSFIMSLPDYVYVTSVLPGGASDRAGMQAGDLITKIRGKTFKNSQQADQILRSNKAGSTVEYEIIRNNKIRTLNVTLSVFGIFFSNIIAILSGLFFMGTGLLIIMQSPHHLAARMLSAASLIFGFLVIILFMQREPSFDSFSILRINANVLGPVIAFLLWFHSFFYFPGKIDFIPSRKKILAFFYGFAALIVLLVLAWDIFTFNITLIYLLQSIFIFSLVITAIVIRIKIRNKLTKDFKSLYKPILNFTIAAVVFEIILALIFSQNIVTQQILGYSAMPLILIPFGYLYTIGRYGLLDMNIRLKRNIQYTFATIFWNAFIILGTLFLLIWLAQADLPTPNITISSNSIEVLEKETDLKQTIVINRIIFILITSVIIYISWRIMRAGQKIINRKFHQSKFDYRQSVNMLSDMMYKNLQIEDLVKTITSKLKEIMFLKSLGLVVFKDTDTQSWQDVSGTDKNEWLPCVKNCSNEIRDFFKDNDKALNLLYSHEGFSEKLRNIGFELALPIRSSKNVLLGFLVLGEKESESPFHQDDLDFLNAAAQQVAFAVENSFLYSELANKERMKLELDIARDIQMSSLPQSLPSIKGLDIAGISIPALEVGGDYFDYLNGQQDLLTVVIGDVSGKGTSSALYMSKIQGIMRSLHSFNLTPSDLFIQANQILRKDFNKKYFITAIAGSFNTKKKSLQIARAGHLPLYYYEKKKGSVQLLTPSGIGFGLGDTQVFAREIQLLDISYSSGDIFVFATDGVIEAFDNQGNEYGEKQLSDCLLKNNAHSASDICNALIENVKNFSGSEAQHDDITVVVVKIL